MQITIKEADSLSDIVVEIEDAEFFPDICRFYVMVEYDPGQPYKAPNRTDPIGDPEFPEEATVHDAWIELGDDYREYISVSQVDNHLVKTEFFSEVCEKIREVM